MSTAPEVRYEVRSELKTAKPGQYLTFVRKSQLYGIAIVVFVVTSLVGCEPKAPELAPAAGEQLWSDAATWGGAVPGDGAEVVIPADTTVVLDINTAPLGALRIEGTLRFAATDVELSAASILVHGALLIGSVEAPHINRATITLTGAPAVTL